MELNDVLFVVKSNMRNRSNSVVFAVDLLQNDKNFLLFNYLLDRWFYALFTFFLNER
jgi:hypothetical protein